MWLLGLGLALATLPAGADVYSFVDEEGVVHFTNVPTDPRYRPIDSPIPRKKPAAKRRQASAYLAPPKLVRDYDEYLREASARYTIPVALIRAVITVESAFNPKAVSHAGAQGLMQLMPATAAEMGVQDVFDPRQNILGGTRYLRTLANIFDGDIVLTLAAYNAGHQAVFRAMSIPPIAETQNYVRRVLQLYRFFKNLDGAAVTPAAAPAEPKKP
jgi:soluble lytic murein transglycosylase-like protein